MGRPALTLGTYGRISVTADRGQYRARCRYRDRDGVTRSVVRYGQTKTAAERSLKAALVDRQAQSVGVNANTRLAELAEIWLAEVADNGRLSPNTRQEYAANVKRYVLPRLGGVRIGEATTGVLSSAVAELVERRGPGAAKSAKAVLSGMFKVALRFDAVIVNPVNGVQEISRPRRDPVRALTPDETIELTDGLRTMQRAVECDIPDLVDWMLGTGCRIGEALAVRDTVITADSSVVEIAGTVVRIKGEGLVLQEWTKTGAGWRRLALPSYVTLMLERRRSELRLDHESGVIFPSPFARALRDPSNTASDLRECLDGLGCDACEQTGYVVTGEHRMNRQLGRVMPVFERDANGHRIRCKLGPFSWVHSHVFRKTVATRLDEGGLSPRVVADQIGHEDPSLTQGVYMGRKVVSPEAARILDHGRCVHSSSSRPPFHAVLFAAEQQPPGPTERQQRQGEDHPGEQRETVR